MPAVTSTRWNIIIKVVKEFWVFVLLYFPAIGLHPCRRLKRSLDKWQSIKCKKVCSHHILGINLITLAIKTLHMLTRNITFDVLKQQKKSDARNCHRTIGRITQQSFESYIQSRVPSSLLKGIGKWRAAVTIDSFVFFRYLHNNRKKIRLKTSHISGWLKWISMLLALN